MSTHEKRKGIFTPADLQKSGFVQREDGSWFKPSDPFLRGVQTEKYSKQKGGNMTIEQKAYKQFGKLKEAAEVLGISAETLRKRLINQGVKINASRWKTEEIKKLRDVYENAKTEENLNLDSLALELNRTVASIHLKASRLGLGNYKRPKTGRRKQQLPKFDSPEERRAYQSKITKERLARDGHPRGALGLKHSKESRIKMAEASKKAWNDPKSKLNSSQLREVRVKNMRARIAEGKMNKGSLAGFAGGKRKDLGNTYFRSSWEANYARYLNWLISTGEIESWEYEPKVFQFEKIKRGTMSYTPDFLINYPDGSHEWHEVKGWMTQTSRTKLKRMAKYFPEEKVIVIDSKWFRSANRSGLSSIIPNWERRERTAK